jgi:hypothetical protein
MPMMQPGDTLSVPKTLQWQTHLSSRLEVTNFRFPAKPREDPPWLCDWRFGLVSSTSAAPPESQERYAEHEQCKSVPVFL